MKSKDRIQIREATPDDAEDLVRLLVEIDEESLPYIFHPSYPRTVKQQLADITKILAAPRCTLMIALADQKIVGMLEFFGKAKSECAHVGALGVLVSKEWRRLGVATKLLENLFSWAPSQGIRRIELEAFATNTGAIKLYESLEFSFEGRKREAVKVGAEYLDVVQMARLI